MRKKGELSGEREEWREGKDWVEGKDYMVGDCCAEGIGWVGIAGIGGDLKKVSLGKGFFASKTNTPNYYRGIWPNIKIRSKTTKTGFFVGYSVYPAIAV